MADSSTDTQGTGTQQDNSAQQDGQPAQPRPGAGITWARPTQPAQQTQPDAPDTKPDNTQGDPQDNRFGGGGMEDILAIAMLMMFLFAMSGGGGKGSGIMQSLMNMFTGGKDPGGPGGPAPTDAQHPVDTKDTGARNTREDEIKGGLYAMASMVNFNKPQPANDIGKRDRAKVADDLYRSGAVAFYNDKTGQYEMLKANSAEALNEAIKNDSKGRIQIDYGIGGEHKYQYLQQTLIADREDSKTGFTAAAWRETDAGGTALGQDGKPLQPGGKENVILGFPGYSGEFGMNAISSTEPQNVALQAMARNELNPQASEAAAFTDKALEITGRDKVGAIITGAHSMGISNARTSEATAQLEGVQTKLIDLEPALDGSQSQILNAALHDKNSPLHQQLAALGISEDKISGFTLDSNAGTTSLRAEFTGTDGQLHTTAIASVASGDGLMQGFMNYMNHRGDPNGTNAMQGATKDYVDVTSLGLADSSMEGHKLVNLITALKDANVTMAEVSSAPTSQASLTTPSQSTGQQHG